MAGDTGAAWTRPSVTGHDSSNCDNCKFPTGDEAWRRQHACGWCQSPDNYTGKPDDKRPFITIEMDGHERCQANGAKVKSKHRGEVYTCQCLCHTASDEEVEAAAFKALQMVLEMRTNARHTP